MFQTLLRMFLGQDMYGFGQSQSTGGNYYRRPEPRQQKPPKGTSKTRVLISFGATVVFGLLYFYFKLPALNIFSGNFYVFILLLCAAYIACMIFLNGFRANGSKEYIPYARKHVSIPFYIIYAVLGVVVLGLIIGLVPFRARAYSKLLTVTPGSFSKEVTEISWDQIPMLDEASANNLANRKLGELSDLVSQFIVNPSSAQINYKDVPVRVTFLNYGGVFKWWNNRSEGIPAYMITDMVTQEVTVIRLSEGIKYSPSEYLGRDLARHLRFLYPTKIFSDINFEISDDGTPYWVASVITRTIGLFGGTDVVGAVLLNAVTGESSYYELGSVPTWVDRVYPSDLIIQQYDYYGRYHNGFLNSLFGQTDCTITTAGYNYIAQDDDVWLYTGITSVTGDRGNIGFILVNQRTKETRYYPCAGAEEFSAMSSAEGAVQQYSYESTFPLLLNISDQPTYFMALKDTAGLVKMYAMVNVQQYQIVSTGYSVSECQGNYHNLLLKNEIISAPPEGAGDGSSNFEDTAAYEAVTGKIEEIRSANMEGDTYFFIRFKGGDVYYTVNAREYPESVILNVGDIIKVTIIASEDSIIPVKGINIS